MAFQAVPNVALTRMEGVVDRQQTINDLYWEISGGGINVVNLTTLTTAVFDWFSTAFASLVSENWSTVRVVGIDLTTQNGPEVSQGGSFPGTVTGEAAPNNVAACISFSTASRGRSFRGRNFIPAVSNGDITLNTLSGTYLSNALTVYGGLVGAGAFIPGWQWGVVSRRTTIGGLPNQLRPTGIITPVTSVTFTTNTVRSMRSREVGHGK